MAGLTFCFPGWLELDKSANFLPAGALTVSPSTEQPGRGGRGRESQTDERSEKAKRMCWGLSSSSAESAISRLPPEILFLIFGVLDYRSLCVIRRVSKEWYCYGSDGKLWSRFFKKLPPSPARSLELVLSKRNEPREERILCLFKNRLNNDRCRLAWFELAKGWDHIRDAFLDMFAAFELEHIPQPSLQTECILSRATQKLTKHAWVLLYDSLAALFTELAEWTCLDISEHGVAADPLSLLRAVYAGWQRYRCWLRRVNKYCGHLNYETQMERSRSDDVRSVHTPSVYQKGLIAFRTSVLLSYALRGRLQAAISRINVAHDRAFHILQCFEQMLEEVSVLDDGVSGERRTQQKLARMLLEPTRKKQCEWL